MQELLRDLGAMEEQRALRVNNLLGAFAYRGPKLGSARWHSASLLRLESGDEGFATWFQHRTFFIDTMEETSAQWLAMAGRKAKKHLMTWDRPSIGPLGGLTDFFGAEDEGSEDS